MFFKLTKYLMVTLMAVMAAGCADTIDDPALSGADKVTLTFRNSEGGARSAESDNSEVAIVNLVVALYPDGPDENTPAVALQAFTGLRASRQTTVSMNLTDDMKTRLFGDVSGASCKLYAVANVDNPEAVPTNATIAQLKGITATSQFHTEKVQPSFVMAGDGTVTYSIADGMESAAGSAELNRAAAKITLNIKLPEYVEDDAKVKWYPITKAGSMRVLLKSGVKSSVACPDDGWVPADQEAYFDISNADSKVVRVLANAGGEYPWQTDVPFYTYPNAWEETPSEKHKTSMTLLVPWQKEGEQTYQTFYYQVPVTDMSKLLPNYSYTVNLNVGMLGSLSPEAPEEVTELSYKIVNWGSADINADFKDYRYLVVSPSTYVVDNEETITIPFYTSHPAEISDITIEYKRYNYYSDGNGEVVTFTIDKNTIDNSVSGTDALCSYETGIDPLTNQHYIRIKHPLKVWVPRNSRGNEISLTGRNDSPESVQQNIVKYTPTSDLSYSPYTIKFKIQHKDNANYNEEVTINQYPGMYIEAVRNPGGSYQTSRNGTSEFGFVYVNPKWTDRRWENGRWRPGYWTNDSNLGGVHGLEGLNKNPNMYIIRVTTLQGLDDRYTIGDPRSQYIYNSLSETVGINQTSTQNQDPADWSNEANALYNAPPLTATDKRTLTYYYPTIEAESGNTQLSYMVAPKIRIASSWGVCTNGRTREQARRRVATYQEQGCPAGRWRLPTLGEFTFITQLSAAGKIPTLFSINSNYLTAQGVYQVSGKGVVSRASDQNYTSVRAVYDEWYWEGETEYVMQRNASGGYDYTLGDMPNNLSRSAARIKQYCKMMN